MPLCGCSSIYAFQSDLFRKHYEAANAAHRAGNYAAAEAEFKVILGQAYETLGKIYSAEGKFDTELNLTRRGNCIERPEGAVSYVSIKANKVGMIEDVEEFRTELESVPFFVSPILRHREVDVCNRLAAD